MRTVYEAASAIEAHMLLDVLRQQGLNAQIVGEHLQGAIGELPAAGLVRLMIDDADYPAARAVIERWEATQPAEMPLPARQVPPGASGRTRFVLGVVAGIGLSWLFCQLIATAPGEPGLDMGEVSAPAASARVAEAPPVPATREFDRNLDGKADFIAHYDQNGMVESADADEDFDGVYETHLRFADGMVELYEVDTDGDGIPDKRMHFEAGMLKTIEILNPANHLPLRVEYYRGGVLFKAEVDTDRDGTLDTRFFYTPLGEVASSEAIEP